MDTVKGRSFNLCVIITLLGIEQFIPGFDDLDLFQGLRYVRIITCKYVLLHSCPLCMLATHIKKIKHSMHCATVCVFKRHN